MSAEASTSGPFPPTPPSQETSQETLKVFNDPIHGYIEFHHFLVKIIDTPQFQRLRNLKQMGAAYFVYPGASHTRFEHSLGVAHLAGQLVRSLKENQPELGIDDRDVLCVQIAGLCHDLGHGPFSHLFDQEIIAKALEKRGKPDLKWTHEKASIDMFDFIVKNLKKADFDLELELKKLNESNDGDDLAFIREMILGPSDQGEFTGRPRDKAFLYEIIANKRNGVDVDKLDYFARDFYHLGIKNEYDHRRFITFARVCEVDGERQICTRDKELDNIYEVFHTRHCIHRKVCQHKTLKIIDHMITEALLEADETLHISDAIDDMEKYTELTDCIFEKILYSNDDDLKKANKILKNVVSRKLYKYLGKTKIVTEDLKDWKDELAKISVSTFQHERNLTKEDFEIIETAFDFGMKEKNPIENMHFYSKFDQKKSVKIPSEQVSQFLLPRNFSEKWINVYCRNPDKKLQTVAYRHFYQWCHKKNFSIPPNPPHLKPAEPQPKVFIDPIHGPMKFHPVLVKIIDTAEFQRLRFIKQLGAASFVYPGATHNCFEHSLGVAHLAGKMVQSLQEKQLKLQEKQPELLIDDKDILCVGIAGLCCDLGHWPFSEDFDETFLQKHFQTEKSKESARLFDQIAQKVNLTAQKVCPDEHETLNDTDVTFIREMIEGVTKEKERTGRGKEKHFLYDIVNNKTNGVDVNVFDRVARDCFQLGLKTNFDHRHVIKFAKVSTDEKGDYLISFRDKVMSTMYDLFHTIAALHSKAYQHNVTMGIQLMMSDVMDKQIQHMTKHMRKEEIYSELTDGLFGDRATVEARGIVKNIHSRKLYKHRGKVDLKSAFQTPEEQKFKDELTKEIKTKLKVEEKDTGFYVNTIHFCKRAGTHPTGSDPPGSDPPGSDPKGSDPTGSHPTGRIKFYGKSGKMLQKQQVQEKKQELSKLQINHEQWIHVFAKTGVDLNLDKEIVNDLEQKIEKKKVNQEG